MERQSDIDYAKKEKQRQSFQLGGADLLVEKSYIRDTSQNKSPFIGPQQTLKQQSEVNSQIDFNRPEKDEIDIKQKIRKFYQILLKENKRQVLMKQYQSIFQEALQDMREPDQQDMEEEEEEEEEVRVIKEEFFQVTREKQLLKQMFKKKDQIVQEKNIIIKDYEKDLNEKIVQSTRMLQKYYNLKKGQIKFVKRNTNLQQKIRDLNSKLKELCDASRDGKLLTQLSQKNTSAQMKSILEHHMQTLSDFQNLCNDLQSKISLKKSIDQSDIYSGQSKQIIKRIQDKKTLVQNKLRLISNEEKNQKVNEKWQCLQNKIAQVKETISESFISENDSQAFQQNRTNALGSLENEDLK